MKKRIIIRWVVWAAVAVPVWYAFAHGYLSTTDYTCIRCRANQHHSTLFGRESVSVEETDYSRWFAQGTPSHQHEWRRGATVTRYPFSTVHDGGHAHPVWQVRPQWQRQFLEGASESEIHSFYAGLESPDRAVQQRAIQKAFDLVSRGGR